MSTVNFGILAHVDAGKTSLTERLLYSGGAIPEIGSVDQGTTQTDTLELERRRRITIKSAVASFALGDTSVNVIDTPGHPDFIAEVERVLSVLDGAVLVMSAVEGVQAQTRLLHRVLRRLRIPTLLFVNKIDRRGARPAFVLADIADSLTADTVLVGTVADAGGPDAAVVPHRYDDLAYTTGLAEVLAEHDDKLLPAFVDERLPADRPELRRQFADQVKRALVHPVYFGSAVTGAGIAELLSGIKDFLPASEDDVSGPPAGTVFKVERGARGEKIAYVRMRSGLLRVRDRLRYRGCVEGKVTAIEPFGGAATRRRDGVAAGEIAKLWGLPGIRVGDTIGTGPETARDEQQFPPPPLEAVVEPRVPEQAAALRSALDQLAEQDPLINLRADPRQGATLISLYGEVQKEVIHATLGAEYGIDVAFRETVAVHVERPAGTGSSLSVLGEPDNPFLATVGLRVERADVGADVEIGLEIELGALLPAFVRAVEEAVRSTLREGAHGWQVIDCRVTLTHSGYLARQSHSAGTFDKSMSSTAGDFRNLTPLVLATALSEAGGTVVCEPVHWFCLEAPEDALRVVSSALPTHGAVLETLTRKNSWCLLEGTIPVVRMQHLQRQLPSFTSGKGTFESVFHHYREVRGPLPRRERAGSNPFHRSEYLANLRRR
ncbi:small GTP-binding protein domain protein [Saccharomonospora marina XMU15]|uniref:Small GTP-binding protein domain protein n=1 Tax=Saccharomonospora marina XMU15 TaxID=882083 RepID=H5X6Y8_9PSEU|nr:TetM/TetW/TetO/TetS family tetracycline resistance ribosomal protection protein [Saccharomonospora marina]EHR52418.1 small GTP-binding protein domain protein [Saccharomonospora marina XMU15]